MVQRYLLDRELLKVRALFSVGMPTLFLGAGPKDACAVRFWHVMFFRSNEPMSTKSCRLGITLQKEIPAVTTGALLQGFKDWTGSLPAC